MEVKLCGFTKKESVEVALLEGAALIGFVFLNGHRNYMPPKSVSHLTTNLDSLKDKSVGVFVDEPIESVVSIVEECQLAYVQLHGSESPAYCESLKKRMAAKVIKAFGCGDVAADESELLLAQLAQYRAVADIFLLDRTKQGTGKMVSPALVVACAQHFPVMIAGGITAHNHQLYTKLPTLKGVDVSGGIENSSGQKDPALIRSFMKSIKDRTKEI